MMLTAFIGSCSSIQKSLSFIPGVPNPDTTKVRKVEFLTVKGANQNNAIQIDILFLMNKDLAKSLPATAAEWFDERYLYQSNSDIILADKPIGLQPKKGVYKAKLPKGYKKAAEVIVYANYFPVKGQKRRLLPNTKSVSIELDVQNWTVSSTNK